MTNDIPPVASDEQLVNRILQGDTEALGELYRRHAAVVRRVITRFAQGISEAEVDELCQDVFLEMIGSSFKYQAEGKFRAWICGVAINFARRWRRRQGIIQRIFRPFDFRVAGEPASHAASPEKTMSLRESVSTAIESLPRKQRDVLILYEVEGFTGEECAEILGIRIGAVWTRLHRARSQIIASAKKEQRRHRLVEGES